MNGNSFPRSIENGWCWRVLVNLHKSRRILCIMEALGKEYTRRQFFVEQFVKVMGPNCYTMKRFALAREKTEKTAIKWQTGLDMKGKTQQIQGVESIRSESLSFSTVKL